MLFLPELSRIGENLMCRNIRAAEVLDEDLRLLGVAPLNVLERLLTLGAVLRTGRY
jgi:hypothetical protein